MGEEEFKEWLKTANLGDIYAQIALLDQEPSNRDEVVRNYLALLYGELVNRDINKEEQQKHIRRWEELIDYPYGIVYDEDLDPYLNDDEYF